MGPVVSRKCCTKRFKLKLGCNPKVIKDYATTQQKQFQNWRCIQASLPLLLCSLATSLNRIAFYVLFFIHLWTMLYLFHQVTYQKNPRDSLCTTDFSHCRSTHWQMFFVVGLIFGAVVPSGHLSHHSLFPQPQFSADAPMKPPLDYISSFCFHNLFSGATGRHLFQHINWYKSLGSQAFQRPHHLPLPLPPFQP